MKPLTIAFTAFGAVLAALQWHQIIYRVTLFYRDYDAQRNVNHIGDGDFTLIHLVNAVLLLGSCFAAWYSWRVRGAWRWLVVTVATANLIAWGSFICMHQSGVLVEYHEFIAHMRQEPQMRP